jgi:hypothetical protein
MRELCLVLGLYRILCVVTVSVALDMINSPCCISCSYKESCPTLHCTTLELYNQNDIGR